MEMVTWKAWVAANTEARRLPKESVVASCSVGPVALPERRSVAGAPDGTVLGLLTG